MLMTFHPYPDFESSVACLDDLRLKRVKENVLEILTLLSKKKKDERLPPGVRIWGGHIPALVSYGCEVCRELSRRGVPTPKSFQKMRDFLKGMRINAIEMPAWLECKELHDSHRSRLLSRNPKLYTKMKWKVKKNLPLFWPSAAKLKGIKPLPAWNLDELIKGGWVLELNYYPKPQAFQAKIWIGPMRELAIHEFGGAPAPTTDRAIQNVIHTFMKEMQ